MLVSLAEASLEHYLLSVHLLLQLVQELGLFELSRLALDPLLLDTVAQELDISLQLQ